MIKFFRTNIWFIGAITNICIGVWTFWIALQLWDLGAAGFDFIVGGVNVICGVSMFRNAIVIRRLERDIAASWIEIEKSIEKIQAAAKKKD